MPPRYAYWTILIDRKPTAFRTREKEELLPTFQQLRRTNKDVLMKWFARGRLWESREEERLSWQRRKTPVGVTPERQGAKASASGSPEPLRGAETPRNSAGGGTPAPGTEHEAPRDQEQERRGRDWRPGGQHRDPRDRFKKRARPRHDRQRPAHDDRKPSGRARVFRPAHKLRQPEAPLQPASDPHPGPPPPPVQTVKKPKPPE